MFVRQLERKFLKVYREGPQTAPMIETTLSALTVLKSLDEIFRRLNEFSDVPKIRELPCNPASIAGFAAIAFRFH